MERHCRFCLDNYTKDYDRFLSPCDCKGSSQYIHESCLRKWALIDPQENAHICPVCEAEYTVDIMEPLEKIPEGDKLGLAILEYIGLIGFLSNYGTFILNYRGQEVPILHIKISHFCVQVLYFLSLNENIRIKNVPRYLSRARVSFIPPLLFAYVYLFYRIAFLNDITLCLMIHLPMKYFWLEHLRVLRRINST